MKWVSLLIALLLTLDFGRVSAKEINEYDYESGFTDEDDDDDDEDGFEDDFWNTFSIDNGDKVEPQKEQQLQLDDAEVGQMEQESKSNDDDCFWEPCENRRSVQALMDLPQQPTTKKQQLPKKVTTTTLKVS